VAGLSGTGLLADDLFLMAHDDVTGRPLLQPRAIGLGLAGGLLAELMLSGQLGVSRGLVIAGNPGAPDGQFADGVMSLVLTERDRHPVCDWLAFLARTSAADVARRLAGAGYLQEVWSRRPRRTGQWVPVDPDCAFASLSRARPALQAGGATAYSATLAGLALACGLGTRLLPYGPPGARLRLREAVARLPPSEQELIAQTQAAVDKAVLTHRS